jgi:hypothetical protein
MLLAEIGATEKQSLLNKSQQLARDPDVKPLAEQGAPVGNQNASKAQRLAADPEVRPLMHLAGNKGSNTTIVRPIGRGSEYLVRRLKRDAPEIAEALARGEYKSARAAGIAAGIVKVPTPLDDLKRAWKKASKEEKDSFRKWIKDN